MHDPMTVICSNRFFTLYHVDPERDGSDDSCGWFMRMRHADQETLKKITQDFVFQWTHGVPKGWFAESGAPNYSTHAIVLAMFRLAANHHFGHWSQKADRFLSRECFHILFFAENSCDSLCTEIEQRYGPRSGSIQSQAERMAGCVYTWILRSERPWWKHPRWHVHHWNFQIHFLQTLRRRLFTRCQHCGRHFRWGESVAGTNWHDPSRRWFESFRSERDCYHLDCLPQTRGEAPGSNQPTNTPPISVEDD